MVCSNFPSEKINIISAIPLKWLRSKSLLNKCWCNYSLRGSIRPWFAFLSLLTRAEGWFGGNTASYFGRVKGPFQQVLAQELSHLRGAMFWGQKCTSVKVFIAIYYCSFPHGNPESTSNSLGCVWCGQNGYMVSPFWPTWPIWFCFRVGGRFRSPPRSEGPFAQWWLKFKSFHVSDAGAPPFWWRGEDVSQKWRGEMRRNEFVISPSFPPKPVCQ